MNPTPILASEWNALMEDLTRARPLVIDQETDERRLHAWEMSVRFRESWEFRIEPGFVNARAAEIDGQVITDDDLWTAIPLNVWRAIGSDGRSASEGVPAFFENLGVEAHEETVFTIDDGGATIQISGQVNGGNESTRPRRLLRAVDLVLVQERPRLITEWVTGAVVATEQMALQLSYAPPNRARPYLEIRSKYDPTQNQTPSVADYVIGEANDTGKDEELVGTIYLVSEPGAELGSVPDTAAWTAYVKHDLFWNLNHATQTPRGPGDQEQIRLPQHLAFGTAADTIAGLGAAANDPANVIAQLVATNLAAGRFWSV